MRHRIRSGLAAAAAVLALGLTACSTTPQASSGGGTGPSAEGGALTPVKLQLQWVTQGQFAVYFGPHRRWPGEFKGLRPQTSYAMLRKFSGNEQADRTPDQHQPIDA